MSKQDTNAKNAIETTAESVGAVLGSMSGKIDRWKKQRTAVSTTLNRVARAARGVVASGKSAVSGVTSKRRDAKSAASADSTSSESAEGGDESIAHDSAPRPRARRQAAAAKKTAARSRKKSSRR